MADVDVRVPIGSGCVGVERVLGSPQAQNQPAHNKKLPSRSSRSSVRRWMLVYTIVERKARSRENAGTSWSITEIENWSCAIEWQFNDCGVMQVFLLGSQAYSAAADRLPAANGRPSLHFCRKLPLSSQILS